VHEEDPLRVLKRLEADGWMKHLAPYWTSAKVNAAEWEKMRESLAQLQMQGIQPNTGAVQFPLITAKLSAKEVSALKKGFPRPGFVAEIDAIEGEAKEFAAQLSAKTAALPSQSWRLIMSANAALQTKFKSFFTEWPQARQKMPYVLMQEMRIVPELGGYDELLEKLFFELMDGKLGTPEEMKAFLEPYSPPAPPPPVNLRRARAAKKDAKPSKARAKKAAKAEVPSDDEVAAEVAEEVVAAVAAAPAPVKAANKVAAVKAPVVKPVAKAAPVKAARVKAAPVKKASAKPPAKAAPAKKTVKAAAKPAPKPVAKKAVPAKKAPAQKKIAAKAAPAKKAVAKKVSKPVTKKSAPSKKAAAKKVVAKAPAKKIVAKKAAVPVKGKAKAAPVKGKSGRR